ncbi:hypothetical protein QFZ36_001186 [Pseudarthrobacter siccitolerans]|uniref:Uncharacterized protein n=1 Tax=Pseudarthrobacter siccitolerans TaxID=861266 RepID=A0ABU0PI55_9MICC|nr:hypothetical protein [Pseudarthrobacter siccitolerans]MDQ0673625.1 hypothetical protein [Pseudarthrobacter siccitolerans]
MGSRWIFDGHIAGIGTGSGLRAVVGIWNSSPFGPFSDVMVQEPSGHRLLLAPSEEVADFISDTYAFDEVRILDVNTTLARDLLTVDAGALAVRSRLGGRTLLGCALRAVPRPLAVHPRWVRAISPVAAVLSSGSRTSGTAGSGRHEYYGVSDLRSISSAVVSWDGADAGALSPIVPAVDFGFSSVPPRPSLARVRTTVVDAGTAGETSPSWRPAE